MALPIEDAAQNGSLVCVLFGKHCAGILCLFVVEAKSALVSKVQGSTLVDRPQGPKR
jgi:hypothetical protein